MKKILFPSILMVLESVVFLLITYAIKLDRGNALELLTIYIVFMFMSKHYAFRSALIWEEIKNISKTSLLYLVTIIVLGETSTKLYIYSTIIITVSMFFVSIYLSRMLRIRFRNYIALKTMVIANEKEAMRYHDITVNNRFAITKVEGVIRLPCDCVENFNEEFGKVGLPRYDYNQLGDVLQTGKVDQLVIIPPENDHKLVSKIMQDVNGRIDRVKVCVNGSIMMTQASEVYDFDGVLLVSTLLNRYNFIKIIFKRTIDIAAGITGCIIVVPLAVYVKRKYRKSGDEDSIFFTQERIGINGNSIKIYKFRTMIPNAEEELQRLMANDPEIAREYKQEKKIKNDPRVTKVGARLRSTSLDEFPQFLNVLKGEMSLVGPRPYLFREKEDMGEYYSSIIQSKPGITGMWQANGRSDVSFEVRCKLDQHYYNNWTPYLDFIIIYKTIKSVIYGKGAI